MAVALIFVGIAIAINRQKPQAAMPGPAINVEAATVPPVVPGPTTPVAVTYITGVQASTRIVNPAANYVGIDVAAVAAAALTESADPATVPFHSPSTPADRPE